MLNSLINLNVRISIYNSLKQLSTILDNNNDARDAYLLPSGLRFRGKGDRYPRPSGLTRVRIKGGMKWDSHTHLFGQSGNAKTSIIFSGNTDSIIYIYL